MPSRSSTRSSGAVVERAAQRADDRGAAPADGVERGEADDGCRVGEQPHEREQQLRLVAVGRGRAGQRAHVRGRVGEQPQQGGHVEAERHEGAQAAAAPGPAPAAQVVLGLGQRAPHGGSLGAQGVGGDPVGQLEQDRPADVAAEPPGPAARAAPGRGRRGQRRVHRGASAHPHLAGRQRGETRASARADGEREADEQQQLRARQPRGTVRATRASSTGSEKGLATWSRAPRSRAATTSGSLARAVSTSTGQLGQQAAGREAAQHAEAVQRGQVDVEQDQGRAAAGLVDGGERGGAVAHGAHGPALTLQRAGEELDEQRVVLDEQHVEADRPDRRRGLGLRGGGVGGERVLELGAQGQRELGELRARGARVGRGPGQQRLGPGGQLAAAGHAERAEADELVRGARAGDPHLGVQRPRGQQGQGRVLELGDPLEEHLARAQQQLAHQLGAAGRKEGSRPPTCSGHRQRRISPECASG